MQTLGLLLVMAGVFLCISVIFGQMLFSGDSSLLALPIFMIFLGFLLLTLSS